MKRKEFILKSTFLLVTSFTGLLFYSSCSEDESVDPDNDQGNCLENGTIISISSNHGHNLFPVDQGLFVR